MLLNDEKSVLSRAVGCRAAAALVSRRVVDAACVLDGLSVTELVLFLLLPQDEEGIEMRIAHWLRKNLQFRERSRIFIISPFLRCRMRIWNSHLYARDPLEHVDGVFWILGVTTPKMRPRAKSGHQPFCCCAGVELQKKRTTGQRDSSYLR